jgi:hypothetical protein
VNLNEISVYLCEAESIPLGDVKRKAGLMNWRAIGAIIEKDLKIVLQSNLTMSH